MKPTDVARLRLRNSGLAGAPFDAPEDVVHHHGAMQAQDYGPATWAIGRRGKGMVHGDVDRALANGSIIRTHVLRPTWHLVAREDLRWMLSLSAARVRRRIGTRLEELGLDTKTLTRCERVIARALEGGNRPTRNEIAEELRGVRIDTTGQRLPYILIHCELGAVICSGGLKGKQHTYALLDERVPRDRLPRDDALVELVRRYLSSHGPASVQDLRWWSDLPVADIRSALEGLGAQTEMIGGVDLFSIDDAPSGAAARGAHLLHIYDEVIVGYSETRFFGDPRMESARRAWIDRSIPNGIVLINGAVAGHFRRTMQPKTVDVEVLLYDGPTPSRTRALMAETNRLARFLGHEARLVVRRLER